MENSANRIELELYTIHQRRQTRNKTLVARREQLVIGHGAATFGFMMSKAKESIKGSSDMPKGQALSVEVGAGPGVSPPNQSNPPTILDNLNTATKPTTTNKILNTDCNAPIKKRHPIPVNRRAREQLQELINLKYAGFESVDVEYWEPRQLDEAYSAYNARRQRECAKMDEFINQAKIKFAKSTKDKSKGSQKNNDEEKKEEAKESDLNSASVLDADDQNTLLAENEVLQSKVDELGRKLKNLYSELDLERNARLEAEKRHEPSQGKISHKSEEPYKLSKTLEEIETLSSSLTKERAQVTKLENDLKSERLLVQSLRAELSSERLIREELQSSVNNLQRRVSELEKTPTAVPTDRNQPTPQQIGEIAKAVEKILEAKIDTLLQKLPSSSANFPPVGSTPVETRELEFDFRLPRVQRKKQQRKAKKSIQPSQPANHATNSPQRQTQPKGNDTLQSTGSLYTFDRTRDIQNNDMLVYHKGQSPEHLSGTTTRKEMKKNGEPGTKQRRNTQSSQKLPKKSVQEIQREKTSAVEKILVIPQNQPQGNLEPASRDNKRRVTAILKEFKIRPRLAGIKNIIEFESGAALLILDKSKAEALKLKLPDIGLQLKGKPTQRRCSFRIHRVPAEDSEQDICDDIQGRLGLAPDRVIKVPYHNPDLGTMVMVIVECDRNLFEAASAKTSILIGYNRCYIDTSLKIMRCKSCMLYGHTMRHCPGISDAAKKIISENPNDCPDCICYNIKIGSARLPRARLRNSRHTPGSDRCRTWSILKQKFVAARQSADLEGAASPIQ